MSEDSQRAFLQTSTVETATVIFNTTPESTIRANVQDELRRNNIYRPVTRRRKKDPAPNC